MSAQPSHRASRRSRRPKAAGSGAAVSRSHDSWKEYLVQEGSTTDPRLCHALASFALSLKKAAQDEGGMGGEPEREDLPGFPWVTPVVGSGCLGQPAPEQLEKLLRAPGRLGVAVSGQEFPGGMRADLLVYPFAKSLLRQRIQELEGEEFTTIQYETDEGFEPEDADAVVSNCLVAAALVMRAWYQAGAISDGVIRQRDTLSLPSKDPRAEEVEVALLTPAGECLRRACAALQLLPPDNPLLFMTSVVERLSGKVENQLRRDKPMLSGHDVDGLVEVAWLMLITPVGLYPGWRDLMAAAALQSSLQSEADGADRAIDFSRPRPALRDVDEAAKVAASVATLASATEFSWKERYAGDVATRIEFYDAVAELLSAQLSYGDDQSPIPAAFVTSMDLELEMSLVRRRERFTVLVPYHFVYGPKYGTDQRTMLFWLAVTVDASEVEVGEKFNLEDLVTGWRDAPSMLDRRRDGIVIVRLVGSPLMPSATGGEPLYDPRTNKGRRGVTVLSRLRSLAATAVGSYDEDFDRAFGDQAILPAFMLDEYSGLHHMAAVVQGGLPANLVNVEPRWIYRFWLALGVQLDDILVRLLVASHVDTSSDVRAMLDHHGVMVNPYVSNAEVDLLAWQGFDVIRAGFERVTPDLMHYAAHMRYRAPEGEDPSTGEPRVPTPWDPEQTFSHRGTCRVEGGRP